MPSKYPGELDTLSTAYTNATESVDAHPAAHDDVNDAVNKIEAELGVNPRGAQSSVATRIQRVEETSVNLVSQGGVGDNSTDNAAAFASAVGALPAGGGRIYVPPGVFVMKSAQEITKPGVTLFGAGWDQSTVTNGSVLKAGVNMASLIKVPSTAPTFRMDGLTLNGAGSAESVLLLESLNCQIRDAQVRQPKTAGIGINVTGESVWLSNLRVNNANQAETTGVQLNGTDATIVGCKPVNCRDGIVLKSNSNGAIIEACHFTPGNTIGRFCIYMSEVGGNLTIVGNRIDNHLLGAAIQLVFNANTRAIQIVGNMFFQNGITDNTYPVVGLDVSAGNCYGLVVTGNEVRSETSHLYSAMIAGIKANGEASTNRGRVKTMGTICAHNNVWAKTMYGAEVEPLVGGTNTFSEAGTTWEVK